MQRETPDSGATDTKTRILDAAGRIFAARGLEAVSLRAVTAEAGVNLAAVNYHFGSKEALLREMVRRFFAVVNTAQLATLDALPLDATVDDLLAAYAGPVFALFDAHRGQEWGTLWMLAASGGERPGRGMYGMQFEGGAEVSRRYAGALARVLPHLPPEELRWRFERAAALLMANQGKYLSETYAGVEPERDERAWLLAFLAGALAAPATPATAATGGDS